MTGKQTHDPSTLNTASQNVMECVRGAQQIAQYAGAHCSLEGAFGFLLQPLQPIHNRARDAVMDNLYGLGDALVSVSQGILETLASVSALEDEIRCHCDELAGGIGDGGGFGGGAGGGVGGGSGGGGPSGGGGGMPVAPPPAPAPETPETPEAPAPVTPEVGPDPTAPTCEPEDPEKPTDPEEETDPEEGKDPDGEKDPDDKDPDEKDPDEKDPDEKDPDEKDPDEKDPDEKDPDEKDPDDGQEPKPGVEGHPLGCRCAGCDVHPAGCQCVLCLGEAVQPGCPPTCTACAGGVVHAPVLAYDQSVPSELRNSFGEGREAFAARWAEREPIVVVREAERLGATLGEATELPGAIPSALDSVVTAAYAPQEGALR